MELVKLKYMKVMITNIHFNASKNVNRNSYADEAVLHVSFTQQKQVKKKETLGCMILKKK